MARMIAVALALSPASASWVGGSAHLSRAQGRTPLAVAVTDESAVSHAKEFLDDAKNEDELYFEQESAAAALLARSDDAIEKLKVAANAAVAAIREADRPEVAAALEARGKSKPSGKLAKALKKPSGTMALVGQGFKLNAISFGGYDLNDPAYVSEQFRMGGCAAVSVSSGYDGELGAGTLAATKAEQDTAKGNFPSPLPAIAHGLIVDEVQLAAAKVRVEWRSSSRMAGVGVETAATSCKCVHVAP